MSTLTFLLGIIVGFIAGVAVSFLLYRRAVKWDNNPSKEVENFIEEFNRYYKSSQRESSSQ